MPGVSAEISKDALPALYEDPNVSLVSRDIPQPALLFKSVGQIGADKFHQLGLRGSGTVALLDTGVDTEHPAIKDAVVKEACFSTSKSTIYKVKSLCPQGFDVSLVKGAAAQCPKNIEGCDHGTHVAGIIGGRNMHDGQHGNFSGVAPMVSLLAVQVFTEFDEPQACSPFPVPCVLSFTSDQLRALEWLYRNYEELNLSSINMSLGGGYHDKNCDTTSALTEMIDRLRGKNIATVVAAGNEGFFDGIAEPACISRAVSVAALDRDGKLDVSYSNVADFVTLAAPGTDIVSLTFMGGYATKSGTSMAAPHVAAALALLHQQNPQLTIKQQLERLAAASHAVADPRTETTVTSMDLAGLAGPEVPVAVAETRPELQNGPSAPAMRGVARAATAIGSSRLASRQSTRDLLTMVADGASYIVKTDKSAAEIAATLNQKCANYNCDVRQVGTNAYKVDIAPKPGQGTRGVTPPVDVPDPKALEEILGGNAKVYDNRLSRPLQP